MTVLEGVMNEQDEWKPACLSRARAEPTLIWVQNKKRNSDLSLWHTQLRCGQASLYKKAKRKLPHWCQDVFCFGKSALSPRIPPWGLLQMFSPVLLSIPSSLLPWGMFCHSCHAFYRPAVCRPCSLFLENTITFSTSLLFLLCFHYCRRLSP